jgi:hypothetical protein
MKWRGQNRKPKARATDTGVPLYGRTQLDRVSTGAAFLSEPVPVRFEDIFKCANEEQTVWRMKGYLDCLRALKEYGQPDPHFVEYLVEKTGEKAP